MNDSSPTGVVYHLRRGGTSVVIDTSPVGLPAILHWGTDLGALSPEVLGSLSVVALAQRVSGGIDVPARLSLLPQESRGWQGTPALIGSRSGKDFSTALATTELTVSDHRVRVIAEDAEAAVLVELDLELTESGLLRQRHTLRNQGDDDYEVGALYPMFPLPASARELLDMAGRHFKERIPQRHPFTIGSSVRQSRRGRPGADSSLLMLAGTPGFGFRQGLVHGIHVAWSGNHHLEATRTMSADSYLAGGELLLPGEVTLGPGESYTTPWVFGSWGDGLDELAGRFHDHLRARPSHPSIPRPVILNTWEAVYFDHSLEVLVDIVREAAEIGVERFVLDDGWFRGRRDDTTALGDWYVDEQVWPDGLEPLVSAVVGAEMEFGLWFEPEMVSPESELARAHPDWMLRVPPRWPVSGRQQQVLNLANPEVWHYLLERIDSLLSEYRVSYVKWDHNRDLLDAGDQATGRPAVHETTAALYRLLAELRRRHPGVEIETCASGGSRIDLGILELTDRVWTSDGTDPLDRLDIQKYTGLLLPYELMGSHVGPGHSHSTRRTHGVDFRAGVAFFGHLGIEVNLAAASVEEKQGLKAWVEAYRRSRPLFHSGRSVHSDTADPSLDVRGVVALDQSEAVYTVAQLHTASTHPVGRVTLPGLDPDSTYDVRLLAPTTSVGGPGQSPLVWAEQPVLLTGRALDAVGIQAPVQYPEHLVVLRAERVS